MSGLTWYTAFYKTPIKVNDTATNVKTISLHGQNTPTNNTPATFHYIMLSHGPVVWVFLIAPFLYVLFEVEDFVFITLRPLISRSGVWNKLRGVFWDQWTVTGNGPFRLLLIFFTIAMFCWVGLYHAGNPDEDICLAIAMASGWSFMLFFTRGIRYTARFTIMVQKMFFRDLIYFLLVYVFIWIAFSTALHALVHSSARAHVTLGNIFLALLNVVTGVGEGTSERITRVSSVGAALLSIYAVLSVILLINMLIAMMGTSYDVRESKTNLFRYQQLSILLLIERRLFWFRPLCRRSQGHVVKIRSKSHTQGKLVPEWRRYLILTEDSFISDVPMKD